MVPQEIFVNGRFLTQPPTGVQKFAFGICKELHTQGFSITFITPQKVLHLPDFGNVMKVGVLNGHLWEQIELPRFIYTKKISELINLCNSAPIILKNINIVTIHDLAFLKNKDWYSYKYRWYYQKVTPLILKKAKSIFTVSEQSKLELNEVYLHGKREIEILRNGINISPTVPTEKLNLPKKFILFVGSFDPRKRLSFLIDAFDKIDDKECQLIVVGKTNSIFGKETVSKSENVIFMNSITDLQLQQLYKEARALVLPSEYEGYGRPILEALYHKTEVICSNIPVFKTNFMNYVHYFETHNIANLTELINQLLINKLQKLSNKCPQEMFSYTFAVRTLLSSLGYYPAIKALKNDESSDYS